MRPLPAAEARVTRLRSPTFGDTRAVALAPLYFDFRESPHMGVMRLGRTHDATLLVLTSLAEGPRHGYALIKDIEAMVCISLGPGTLYGVLARLEEEGMIQPLPSTAGGRTASPRMVRPSSGSASRLPPTSLGLAPGTSER